MRESSEHHNFNKILFLACNVYLAPRVQLEKEALQDAGFETEVLYRDRIKWNLKVILGLAGYYIRAIRACARKDIAVVHLTHIGQLPMALLLKLFRKKVIYDAYERHAVDISEQHAKGYLPPSLVQHVIEFFENLFVRFFVDGVLVVSTPGEYLTERYRKYCKHVECLYNVPKAELVYTGSLEEKFNRNPLMIAYAGGMNEAKGLKRFVPLAKKLKGKGVNFVLHLLGQYRNEQVRERLLDEIKNAGLEDTVRFHGHMDYQSLHRFLGECHVGLTLFSGIRRLSHVGRGTVRKNFEYMAAGMVPITSNVGDLGRVVEEEGCGLLVDDPDDLEQISSLIRELDSDRKRAIELSQKGLEAVKRTYNWENEKSKLFSVYSMVMSA